MKTVRLLAPFAMTIVIVAVALVALQGGSRNVPIALAGPCGAPPQLLDGPQTGVYTEIDIFTTPNKWYRGEFYVYTYPLVPPTGKDLHGNPYATISIQPISASSGITFVVTPDHANSAFPTTIDLVIADDTLTGTYSYNIHMVCHPFEANAANGIADVPLTIYVNTCPLPVTQAYPRGGSPTPEPIPTSCSAPSPTPATREMDVTWGDVDCDGEVSPADALALLKEAAFASPTPTPGPGNCPRKNELVKVPTAGPLPFGDVDCSGETNAQDAIDVLKFLAAQPITKPNCPNVGVSIKVGSYYLLPD